VARRQRLQQERTRAGGTAGMANRQAGVAARTDNHLTTSQPEAASESVASLGAMGFSEPMAKAALERTGGSVELAVLLLVDHRALLAEASQNWAQPSALPDGVIDGVLQGNPGLKGLETAIAKLYHHLCQEGLIRPSPWGALTDEERQQVFYSMLVAERS